MMAGVTAAAALPLGRAVLAIPGHPGFQYGHTATLHTGGPGDGVDLHSRLFAPHGGAPGAPSPHWDAGARRFAGILRYSPCGGVLYGACNDGTVLAWDVDTLALVWAAAAHDGPVTAICVDGRSGAVVTCGADGAVRVWCA